MEDFASMNEAYDEFFTSEPKPVSTVLWFHFLRGNQLLTFPVPDLRCCQTAALQH